MIAHRLEEWEHLAPRSHRCAFPVDSAAYDRANSKPRLGIRYRCFECLALYVRTELGWQRLP